MSGASAGVVALWHAAVAAAARYWFAPVPASRLALMRILVSWLLLYDAWIYDPRSFVALHASGRDSSWRPILLFEWLGIGPATPAQAEIVHHLLLLAVFAMALGWRARTACFAAAVLSLWSAGMVYSLTKVRHDRVALCFASFALAFSPCGRALALGAARAPGPAPGWPLRLTQVSLAIGYGAAGLAKLFTPEWTNGYSLQGIVIGHAGPGSPWASAPVWCYVVLSWLTIVAEAGLPLVLRWPRLAFGFVPALIGFHMATWASMDTGPYMTLWYLLFVFVPLETALSDWRRLPALARAGVAIVGLAVCGVVVFVLVTRLPVLWLLTQSAVTALAVRWSCPDLRPATRGAAADAG